MNIRISGGFVVLIGAAAFVFATGPVAAITQSSAAPGANPQTSRTSADQQVTVMGRIQREADYRRSTGASPGGAANTGVGAGNEFILANAMMSPASSSAQAARVRRRQPGRPAPAASPMS